MGTVVFNFLTAADIRSAECARRFFQNIRCHLDGASLKVYGIVEPLSGRFENGFEEASELWASDLFWSDNSSKGSGAVLHGTPRRHSVVNLYFDCPLEKAAKWSLFLKDVSKLLDADYSCIHYFDGHSHSKEDELLEGLTSHDLQDWLPTIAWASCFGKPYVELFGRSKIEATPFHSLDWITDETVYAQLTELASDYVDSYESFQMRREAAKSSLGLEYFFDSSVPTKKAEVPRFDFAN